jgi:hypothetical protein
MPFLPEEKRSGSVLLVVSEPGSVDVEQVKRLISGASGVEAAALSVLIAKSSEHAEAASAPAEAKPREEPQPRHRSIGLRQQLLPLSLVACAALLSALLAVRFSRRRSAGRAPKMTGRLSPRQRPGRVPPQAVNGNAEVEPVPLDRVF